MVVNERIAALRAKMAEHGIDAYIIPSGDYHQSEYVGKHFTPREFITGYTGSVGTAVITADDAALWVDGRYWIQAEAQLEGSCVRMFKMGVEGVDTLEEYLVKVMPQGGKLGFDGRVVAYEDGMKYAALLADKGVSFEPSYDLVDQIWTDRPPLAENKAFILEARYNGESTASKLARLREKMRQVGATHHAIFTLDDIVWIMNLRGTTAPLFLSYFMMDMDGAALYIDEERLNPEIMQLLENDGIKVKPYEGIYADISALPPSSVLLFDPNLVNYALARALPEHCKKIEIPNPTLLMKACKNEVELENIRRAQIKDGIAQTKFMHWLKTNVGKIDMDEIGIGEKLREFRAEQEGFIRMAFHPIAAYREHAAMMHYRAKPESQKTIKAEHLLLTDSGGDYIEGSTDITRTYVLGAIDHEIKVHFTAVVRGVVNLSRTKFLKGVRGMNLDAIARQPLWDVGVDYKSGTGHGVGYMTTIHEGPCRIRWEIPLDKPIQPPIDVGMVFSNEPGAYVAGSHGIRIENEIVARLGEKNEHGQFLYFETITFTPIDLDAILPEMMLPAEKEFLNSYHKKVYELVASHMDEEQREWLKVYTREI